MCLYIMKKKKLIKLHDVQSSLCCSLMKILSFNDLKNFILSSKIIRIEYLKFIKKLKVKNTNDIDITHFKYLNYLDLRNLNINIHNTKVSSLKNLNLFNSKISNISSILQFKNLEYLNLTLSSINSLCGFEKLTNLKKLFLKELSILDLSPLSKLLKLEYLDISNTNIINLNPIENLNIRYLNIDNTNIKILKNLHKLIYLSCNNVNIYIKIKYLENMQFIDIRGNNINNYDFLYKLSKKCNVYLNRHYKKEINVINIKCKIFHSN